MDHGCLVMADLSSEQEADNCLRDGADIIGTTMSGYTGEAPTPEEPDFPLLEAVAKKGCFVIAEGRFSTPELCRAAIERGAGLRDRRLRPHPSGNHDPALFQCGRSRAQGSPGHDGFPADPLKLQRQLKASMTP